MRSPAQLIFTPILALAISGAVALAGDGKAPRTAALSPESATAKIMAGLAAADPRVVLNALDDLQEQKPTATNAFASVRKLLNDPRPSVRRKSARVLGELKAPVTADDIDAICRMLNSFDVGEAGDALKSLRGLNAPQAIPKIRPFLQSQRLVLVREACRTLATLGGKDLIPDIEPLLKHPNAEVRRDAQSALTALRAKP